MLRYSFYVCFACLLFAACKKESALQPSNIDGDMLTVKDNPNDPVDHAIYQFYQQTGIPCYYNDTIGRVQTGEFNGQPRYNYSILAVAYAGSFGRNPDYKYVIPVSKQPVLPLLDLLKTEVVAKLPKEKTVYSILFLDTLKIRSDGIVNETGYDQLIAYAGFNTLAVRIAKPDTFTVAQRKDYIASILGAVCFKKIMATPAINLPDNFYSISRKALGSEIYLIEFTSLWPPDAQRKPEEFGLISYLSVWGFIITPEDYKDMNSFVKAVFQYSTTEFAEMYGIYPVTMEKFNVMRKIIKDLGFKIPD